MDINTNNCECGIKNYADEVCVNVQRIYDTCKDKDCFADLRVYLSPRDQQLVDCAVNVRARDAKLLWTLVDLEPVPFNKGYYSIDIMFFLKLEFEVYTCNNRPEIICGLASADKRVILFGSEGNTYTFSSQFSGGELDKQARPVQNLPTAQVEVVDPIILSTKVLSPKCDCCCHETDVMSLPACVSSCFCDGLTSDAEKQLVVTIGIFSIVRIIRDVQILIPSAKFCLPEKECKGPCEEEPCSFFEKLCFPTNEFFPPDNKKDCKC